MNQTYTKVDHFTVFESFPITAHTSSHQIRLKRIGLLDMRGSIRDVYTGWVVGMDWQEKIIVQNCGRALVKPKNQGCAGSLMAEMKHYLH